MSTPMSVGAEVLAELNKASAKFPPFNSGHEGYAVLLEEVDELKEEVFWGPSSLKYPMGILIGCQGMPTKESEKIRLMRAEAIQVAAMAMRFVLDVCDKESNA